MEGATNCPVHGNWIRSGALLACGLDGGDSVSAGGVALMGGFAMLPCLLNSSTVGHGVLSHEADPSSGLGPTLPLHPHPSRGF